MEAISNRRWQRRLRCNGATLGGCLIALALGWPATASADLMVSLGPAASGSVNWDAVSKLVAEGKLTEARAGLQAIAAADPSHEHPEVLLGQILLQQGKVAQGRQVLDQLAVSEPERYDLALAYAQLAVGQQRWYDARAILNQASTLAPPGSWTADFTRTKKQAWVLLSAACFEGQQQAAKAEPLYKGLLGQAAISDALKGEALQGQARCLAAMGQEDAALLAFRAWLTLTKQPVQAELLLARQLRALQKPVPAETWYRTALKSAAADTLPAAQRELAQFLLWSNRPEELPELLPQPAEESAEDRIERLYLLGLAARMQQRFDDALEIFSPLNQQEPTRFAISNQLALVLIESTDEAKRGRALQIAQANVNNNPQLGEAWSTLGWVQLRLGDTRAAADSLTNACRGGSINRDTAYYIAVLGQRSGRSTPLIEQMKVAAVEASGPFFYASSIKQEP